MDPTQLQILAMLARYPEPGRVKTRLAAEIGDHAGDRVYRAMLRRCVASAREACRTPNRRFLLFVEPANRVRDMADWLGLDGPVHPQPAGDLGVRMRETAANALRAGAAAVVLMGSDCPLLTANRLNDAFEQLASNPVVLGPAADGGYYLIGLGRMIPELFDSLPWGADTVFRATVAQCRRFGFEPATLETLPDVDRREDLTEDVLGALGLTWKDIDQGR